MEENFDLQAPSNGWYAFRNPFEAIEKRGNKMAVNFTYGWVKCWRTGYSEPLSKFLKDYSELKGRDPDMIEDLIEQREKWNYETNKEQANRNGILPDRCELITENARPVAKRAREYLLNRGVTDKQQKERYLSVVADRNSIYYGYVIIPFFHAGHITYYIGRDYTGRQRIKYLNPKGMKRKSVLYNMDALLGEKVYITEGVFDAITLGTQAVATLGWALSYEQMNMLRQSPAEELVIVPDKHFFFKTYIPVVGLLGTSKVVKVLNLDNEKGKDANEIGAKRILELEKETKEVDMMDYAE